MAIGHHCCYLLLLCLSCFLFSFSNANDTAIMLKLSASISPTPPSWKTNNNNNFCNWEGISCDNSNRVTNISLSNKSLDGTLPSDLNNLSQLKILDLSYNSLSGAIPTLANLAFLEEVSLLNNNFTSIPFNFFLGLTNLQRFSISFNFYLAPWILPYDLIQCTNLRTFSARQVNLIGSIPDIFNNLTNLEVLRLSNNRLNGTLPSSLNNLSHLKMLELDKNSLSGTPTLANLTLLETVHLGTNKFTSIPFDFFLGLTNLQVFGMSYNLYLAPWILPANSLIQCSNLREFSAHQVNLTSSIPDIFNNLPYLEILGLSRNRLNGTLPSSLNNLSHLKYLYLEINSLSGTLPTLANLALLETVYLDNNNFSSIPFNFFQGLTNLKTFKISNNSDLQQWILPYDLIQCTKLVLFQAINAKIISSIPDIFNSLLSLQDLRLAYNNLTGKLPATFGRSNITHLFLDNQLQGLSGTLDVISEMTQLRKLWLQANAFTGAIPDLSKCTNLEDLQLSDNQLTGLVSDSLIYHSGFALVTLENNRLQGPLPVFARDVESLLDNNSFCLPTPGKCDPQVTALLEVAGALGYPMSLAKSWKGNDACGGWNFVTCDSSGKNVTIVNFGKQKFLGTISPSFANLTSLRNLSMNENNLTGSIPEVLKSLPHLQFLDVSNNNLSGPVPEFPQNVTFLHTNNPFLGKHSNRQSASIGMVIGVVISALIFVGIIVAFVSYKCYRFPRKLHIQTTRDHGEIPISEGVNVTISIQLLEKVTDSFSDDNVLGRGGFGIVYKGELHDGTKIAVKRMQSDVKGTQGIKEFHAEIEVLTKVRHRHLVALLGFCISGNERLLVYEYMAQGALSQHLFKWRENKSLPLSWKQRVSIALDVGRGVEYLHRLAQQSFIHRDLKPANILLDDHMRAKVCDFGLVKNAPDGKYSIETRLAGTFGYLAPEYAATGRVTTKVDVYAFGVVLMQLITGRKALDGTMSDERYPLVTWFRKVPVCKENMIRFRDQVLDTDDCETLESILEVADLARHCTASQPFQRPDMGYVVSVLCHLVEKWKPTQHEEEKTYSHQHHRSLPELLDDDDTSRMLNVFRLNSF